MSEYTLVLLAVCLPTILLAFHPQSHMRGKIQHILIAIILSAIPFIIWDIWAYQRGHWGFNPAYISSITLFSLPLEEVLFFICIPYSSLYIWLVLRDFSSWENLRKRITNS